MQIIRHKKLYLPAFSIIAVVLLLILLVAVLTYRTLAGTSKKNRSDVSSQSGRYPAACLGGGRSNRNADADVERRFRRDPDK
jgi:hypothetical protein